MHLFKPVFEVFRKLTYIKPMVCFSLEKISFSEKMQTSKIITTDNVKKRVIIIIF